MLRTKKRVRVSRLRRTEPWQSSSWAASMPSPSTMSTYLLGNIHVEIVKRKRLISIFRLLQIENYMLNEFFRQLSR